MTAPRVPSPSPASEGEPPTFFDSPERSQRSGVRAQAAHISAHPLVLQFLEAYPGPALLLDANRQIVAFNTRASDQASSRVAEAIYGARTGELLGCLHAFDRPAGCGTTAACAECGAARAIRFTRLGNGPAVEECHLTVREEGQERALDLRTYTSSVTVDGEVFTLALFEDIEHEKRRETLERVFFHDVLNTAQVLTNAAHLVADATDPRQRETFGAILLRSASQLIDEIQAQRDLMLAERGDLGPTIEQVSANALLARVRTIYDGSPLLNGRRLVQTPLQEDVLVSTDEAQATRCLGNLVKNALEAAAPDETVRLRAEPEGAMIGFRISNAAVIPASAQRQIFQRSFTSKPGRGRGIGTYSVKLIVEHYLSGTVSFVSNEREGTVFSIHLPRATATSSVSI